MLRSISKSRVFKPAFQSRTLASISKDLNDAYDVVIIGGGVAGATLACSLGNNTQTLQTTAGELS